ncbi:MAG: hypothetical protein Q8O99_00700 [bacterium]|nr:hypothetical protein [bacterium]
MIDLAVLNMLKATTDQKNVLTKYRTYLALDPNAKQNKITELFDQFFSKKEAQRTLNKWEFGTNPNETFSRCMITTLLFGDGKAKGIKEVASTSPTKENPEKDYITPVECKENGNGTFVLEHTPQNTPIRYKIGDDQEAVFIEYPNRPVQIPDLPKPLIITLGQKKADGSMDEQFQKSLDIGLQGVAYTKTSTEDRDTLTFAGLDTTKYYNLKIEYTEPSKTDIKTFEENNFLGTKTTYEISGTAKKVELQEKGAKAWKVIG